MTVEYSIWKMMQDQYVTNEETDMQFFLNTSVIYNNDIYKI